RPRRSLTSPRHTASRLRPSRISCQKRIIKTCGDPGLGLALALVGAPEDLARLADGERALCCLRDMPTNCGLSPLRRCFLGFQVQPTHGRYGAAVTAASPRCHQHVTNVQGRKKFAPPTGLAGDAWRGVRLYSPICRKSVCAKDSMAWSSCCRDDARARRACTICR